MKKLLRRRPNAAMVVAVVALVAALGGTAVAAQKFGLSVLSNGAKNKTVGVGKLTYVSATATGTGGSNAVTVSATCPAGTHVIGGGVRVEDPNSDFIDDSFPTPTGWAGRVSPGGDPGTTHTFIATAICATSRAVTGAPVG
ncbi:MAG TPA: hypothetical protein VH329_06605 [Solirubrobacterales bacterium]|jgi:hypothetical protein